jgi:hypothetical protein
MRAASDGLWMKLAQLAIFHLAHRSLHINNSALQAGKQMF